MSFRLRRIALSLMAVLAALAVGCGGDNKNNGGGEDLSAAVASDVAAAFAGMLATDNGGWMTEVKSSFDATPRFSPGLAAKRIGSEPIGLAGDTTFTRGTMSWNLNYTYYDALNTPSEIYGPGTDRAVVVCNATGNVTLPGGGTTHVYVHRDTMHVDNMQDTLVTYSAITLVDTAFVTMGTKYYFFDNLVDYSAEMRQHPVTAWPFSGEATIDGFVDALRSPSRSDRAGQYDVVMTITFDGTQTPLATVSNNVENPVSVYTYRVDLKTGAYTPVSAAAGIRARGRIAAAR